MGLFCDTVEVGGRTLPRRGLQAAAAGPKQFTDDG